MTFMCLSLISLALIIYFHVVLEELRTNNFTKLKVPLYVCLFISFLIVVMTQTKDYMKSSTCIFFALALQFFSLSIFFWMTAMSYDIWLGFRIIANPLQNIDKKRAHVKMRLVLFYLFSILGPLIITSVTSVIQYFIASGGKFHPK